MVNQWVQHIKDYAKRKNISYACALSSEGCKNEYNKKKEKQEQKEVKQKQKEVKQKQKEVKNVKGIDKEIKESFDKKSSELQQLIFITPIDKIKKALSKLNYKGKMQTNKLMLNMQLLENFNTIDKMQDLIDLLK